MEQGLIDITQNLATSYPDTHGVVVFKDFAQQKRFYKLAVDSFQDISTSGVITFDNGSKVFLFRYAGDGSYPCNNMNINWFVMSFYNPNYFLKMRCRLRAGEPGLAISMSSYPV